MDALLSAARKGTSVIGTRLFVTTFPCHYCARHIVAAGVDEVRYIEPYPKSQALNLQKDPIAIEHSDWKAPSQGGDKVLFRPFSGVAPTFYERSSCCGEFAHTAEMANHTVERKNVVSEWQKRQNQYGRSYNLQLETSNLTQSINHIIPTYHSPLAFVRRGRMRS